MNNKFYKSDKFKHGTIATVFIIVFIALVVVLNVVVSMLSTRFPSMNIDLTQSKLNTLSDDAVNIAEKVENETTVSIIGSEDAIRNDQVYSSYNLKYSQVANLADKMQEKNGKIKVEFIDPDLNPAFISEYADDNLTSGCVVVKTDARYKVLNVTDLFDIQQDSNTGAYIYLSKVDGALANAVHLANLDKVPVVAVATGHEEMLASGVRASLDKLLEDNSFEVREFNLLTEDIPEEAQLVLLPTPTTDYTKDEIDKLRGYVDNDTREASRSLMITCEPSQAELPNLASFLEEWGIKVGNGVVLESDDSKVLSSYAGAAYDYMFTNSVNEIFEKNTYDKLLSIDSRPIEMLFTSNNDIRVTPLIQTNDTAYVSTDNTVSETPDTSVQTTAVLAQKGFNINNNLYRSNLIVFGDSRSFLENYLGSSAFSNRSFVKDIVKYGTDTSDVTVGITVEETQTNTADITATASVVNFVGFVLFTILVPLAILIAGLVIFLRRRHL